MHRVVVETAGPSDLPAVREMLHEYAAWLAIDLDFQGFSHEVQDLPGGYRAPEGALLIARLGDAPAGMVALRRVDDERCEMKRLYVRPSARGTGVGRQLVDRIIAEARARGYREMLLDTLPVMRSAQQLYLAVGFRDIPPYYASPLPGTRYMALTL